MATVFNLRPYEQALTTGVDESMHGQGVREVLGVLAVVDLFENGTELRDAVLLEADNAGLVAEFEAGVATTILETAVGNWIGIQTETDPLSSTQRTWLGSYSEAYE